MNQLHLQSPAFQQARLKSERLRVRIILATIAAAFVIRSIVTVVLFSRENLRLWATLSAFMAAFALYELFVLTRIHRTMRTHSAIPRAAWIANMVLETTVPGIAVVFLADSAATLAYLPVANPGVLLYFIFILLSTLRLDSAACIFSGLVAAASYLSAAVYLGWRPAAMAGKSLLSPERSVLGYTITFVVAGFIAAAIANEVRKQVDAALNEAELKRQMEHLEHDLEVARSIQQSLLPTSAPQIAGFEIAGWNQPADQTGGDYYDWQFLPDGKLLIALADVTGHGIGPALLAAVCRAYARAHFTRGDGLLGAMERVNTALLKDIGEARFATFVAVICDPQNPVVELLSAGHGPMFLYWLREDRFDEIAAQGLPLGLMPSLGSDPPLVLDFHPGDLLVITTDGFFEWENAAREQFGVERLQQVVRSHRDLPPAEIISSLYKAVIAFSAGTKQKDDLTAIVIKRT